MPVPDNTAPIRQTQSAVAIILFRKRNFGEVNLSSGIDSSQFPAEHGTTCEARHQQAPLSEVASRLAAAIPPLPLAQEPHLIFELRLVHPGKSIVQVSHIACSLFSWRLLDRYRHEARRSNRRLEQGIRACKFE